MPLAYSASRHTPILSQEKKNGARTTIEIQINEDSAKTSKGGLQSENYANEDNDSAEREKPLLKTTSREVLVSNSEEDVNNEKLLARPPLIGDTVIGDTGYSNVGALQDGLTAATRVLKPSHYVDDSIPIGVNADALSTRPSTGGTRLKVEPRLRARGLMVPPASDAATLRRQVAALQLDLEAHIDGEQNLWNINQQLHERLEICMKQNRDNVGRVEFELTTLHEDMEQTLELQRKLAQRASQLEKEKKELDNALQMQIEGFQHERTLLQSQICNLSEGLQAKQNAQNRVKTLQEELDNTMETKSVLKKKLEDLFIEAENMRFRSEEYAKELSNMISATMVKEQFCQAVEDRGRKTQLRRWFLSFQLGVTEKRALSVSAKVAAEFYERRCLKRGIYAFSIAARRSCLIRTSQSRQIQICLYESWRAWNTFVVAERMYALNVEQYKRKSLFIWRDIAALDNYPEESDHRLSKIAVKHWNTARCRSTLKQWAYWIRNIGRPKKMWLKWFECYIVRFSCKRAIISWQSAMGFSQKKKLGLKQMQLETKHCLQKRAFKRWEESLNFMRRIKGLTIEAILLWKHNHQKFAFQGFCEYLLHRKNSKILRLISFRHQVSRLESQCFKRWKEVVKHQKDKRKALLQVHQALLRTAMVFWKNYYAMCMLKKQNERRVTTRKKRRDFKRARLLLEIWRDETSQMKLFTKLERILKSRRVQIKIQKCLNVWMHGTLHFILVARSKLQENLLEIKAQCEEEKEQTKLISTENVSLVGRLNVLSDESALLKAIIAEKEKKTEELHHALEDGAFLESSLQGELEQREIHIVELQKELLELQRALHEKNVQDAEDEIKSTLEIQKLQMAIKDLQRQLTERSSQIDVYEKVLKETVEKIEGASDESREKLTSAFDIAASLRNLLDDHERQFNMLQGNCMRKDLELAELRKKLELTSLRLTEIVEARDLHVQELEDLLAKKEIEVQNAQLELDDFRLQSNRRDNSLRKLEYELKLKSDEEAYMARTVLFGLTGTIQPQCFYGESRNSSPEDKLYGSTNHVMGHNSHEDKIYGIPKHLGFVESPTQDKNQHNIMELPVSPRKEIEFDNMKHQHNPSMLCMCNGNDLHAEIQRLQARIMSRIQDQARAT